MNHARHATEQLVGQDLQTTGKHPSTFRVISVDDSTFRILLSSTGRVRPIPMREIEAGLVYSDTGKPMRPIDIRREGISEVNPAYIAAIIPELRKILYK